MKDAPIFSITVDVDTDTVDGARYAGCLDYEIHYGRAIRYLETHGEEGMDEIEKMTARVLESLRHYYLKDNPRYTVTPAGKAALRGEGNG